MITQTVSHLDKVIVIGDRVLVKPKTPDEKTSSGLYLPPGVHENEKIVSGYVMKVGPGYPVPLPDSFEEPWKTSEEKVKYIPLQAKEGDLAIFIQKAAYEIIYKGERYYIVPLSSILMLERDEDLFV